jgi:hypothetical protein
MSAPAAKALSPLPVMRAALGGIGLEGKSLRQVGQNLRERVERLGPVEREQGDRAVAFDQDRFKRRFRGHSGVHSSSCGGRENRLDHASSTSSGRAGFQRGALSLSMITARTPRRNRGEHHPRRDPVFHRHVGGEIGQREAF